MSDNRLTKPVEKAPAPQPLKLLDQLHQTIRLKHMSRRTEESYVYYARQFILFHNKRHPKELGAEEIRGFLSTHRQPPVRHRYAPAGMPVVARQ